MKLQEDALLCGIMLGDGCLSIHKRKEGGSEFRIVVTLNARDTNLTKLVYKLFKKLNPDRKPLIVKRPKWNAIEVRLHSKETLYKLSKRWKFPVGLKRDIKIPEIFTKRWSLMKFVLTGLFATDGTLIYAKQHRNEGYYPRIEFYSSSNKLLSQVHKTLQSRGFKLSVWSNRLSIHGNESFVKFKKEIGFLNDGQINKLKIYTYSKTKGILGG